MTVEPLLERVGLGEAADILGVHYMTVYRYVRTGRLAAKRESARWSVAVDDLHRHQSPPPGRPNGSSRLQRRTQMTKRMIHGDEVALTSGRTPTEVYTEIVAPCLRLIGDQWESGQVSVAEEHRSSVVALRIIGRLGPQFARRGKSRGTVVMGAVAGEWHALPGLMLADVVRARGFEPLDLGANTPAVSFVEAAQSADRLVAVLVGATTSDSDEALRESISALRSAGVSVPILAGGRALRDEAHALALGVDAWSGYDASMALAAVEWAHATSLSKVE
jgi:methanogenic corrinoid protein MtbC1